MPFFYFPIMFMATLSKHSNQSFLAIANKKQKEIVEVNAKRISAKSQSYIL